MKAIERSHAWMILNGVPDIGPVTVRALLPHFDHHPEAILMAEASQLAPVVGKVRSERLATWDRWFDLERELALCRRLGIDWHSCESEDYPQALREIPDAPLGLYWRGAPVANQPAIAIVGTRNISNYGRKLAREFSRELSSAGYHVISGMAGGIDTEVHKSVLEANGSTSAILGNGVDVVYPAANRELYENLISKGGVGSEFVLGRRADRQSFPQRNRIVAGMSVGTIVIESGSVGGSLITARFANEAGRIVMAVPGRVDSEASAGCHQLIRDGATLVTSVEDVLSELKFQQPELEFDSNPNSSRSDLDVSSLSESERIIADLLRNGDALFPDQIVELSGLPLVEVTTSLVLMDLKRLVGKSPTGAYERIW